MSRLTERERRAARELRSILPTLSQKDVVFATLADGSQLLIKGRNMLDRIIASGRSEPSDTAFVPVLSAEAAAALERVLGSDGCFSQPKIMGHA